MFCSSSIYDNQVVDDQDIEKYILETYRPLTSPNGAENWTVLGRYSVHFPPPVLGDREVWVEIAVNHFCTVANGISVAVVPNIPGYPNKPSNRPYYKKEIGGLFGTLRRKFRDKSATPTVRLGNVTKARVRFSVDVFQCCFCPSSNGNMSYRVI